MPGWESVCGGVLGFPFLKIKKCLGFLVSWFLVSWFESFLVSWLLVSWNLGFKDSWFLGFEDCWFLDFKVSRIYQIPISCFLLDIGRISEIFEILLNGSSGFFGAHLF